MLKSLEEEIARCSRKLKGRDSINYDSHLAGTIGSKFNICDQSGRF
jgi:hypothetical protein